MQGSAESVLKHTLQNGNVLPARQLLTLNA